MKTLIILFALVVGMSVANKPVFAQESAADPYADAVVAGSDKFLSSESSLGAPDFIFSDNISGGGTLTLDMGDGEEGLGDLTLHYAVLNPQVQITFTLYDSSNNVLLTSGSMAPLSNVWIVPYDGEIPYRYVSIWNSSTKTIRIDAVEAESYINEQASDEEVAEEQIEVEDIEIVDANPLCGSLIKLADDWNNATDADKTIYLLDADNVRHVIPNEKVFESWGLSYNDVTIVGDGTLTGIPMGKNVYVRPGTYLVKIQLSPEVYAVEPGGVLRWIQTEKLARQLYGDNWNQRVIDVPEVLFTQYTFAGAMTELEYPAGSFVMTETGATSYIDAESKRWSVGPLTKDALELYERFITIDMSDVTLAATHAYAGRLVYNDNLRWPF
jgi:hypothetical protein